MPKYIYGCDNKEHPRYLVVHGMLENPVLNCEVCGCTMHRIPQTFLFGLSPINIYRDWCERNWRHYLRKEPREYMYNQVSTDRGKAQKNYGARK